MAVNKILLVDDSPAQLNEMKDAVKGLGAKVISATSGQDAVEKAKAEKPDIIFMDIIMEGLDGYGACREMSADPETKKIPIIFVSTKNQRADRVWAEKLGARNFITKPFTKDQILDEIKKY